MCTHIHTHTHTHIHTHIHTHTGCQPSVILLEGLEYFTPRSSTSILNSTGELEKSFLKVKKNYIISNTV